MATVSGVFDNNLESITGFADFIDTSASDSGSEFAIGTANFNQAIGLKKAFIVGLTRRFTSKM